MSEILWCDPGNHQFNANDPDRKTWNEQQSYADANAGKKPLRFDACGEHRGYDGMGTDKVKEQFQAMQDALKPKPRSITAQAKRIAELEKELGINQD